MRRVVVLEMKAPKKSTRLYKSCPELVSHNKDDIGIGLGALWNALYKGHGFYENKKCKIYYKDIERYG